jgi:hypothetical protein
MLSNPTRNISPFFFLVFVVAHPLSTQFNVREKEQGDWNKICEGGRLKK